MTKNTASALDDTMNRALRAAYDSFFQVMGDERARLKEDGILQEISMVVTATVFQRLGDIFLVDTPPELEGVKKEAERRLDVLMYEKHPEDMKALFLKDPS